MSQPDSRIFCWNKSPGAMFESDTGNAAVCVVESMTGAMTWTGGVVDGGSGFAIRKPAGVFGQDVQLEYQGEREMKTHLTNRTWLLSGTMLIVVAGLTAGYTGIVSAKPLELVLSGKQEVPPVETMASGDGTIAVNPDRTVTGSITTKGVNGTMAHIHEAAAGKNGPVIIPLKQGESGTWEVPAGAKLTKAQYQAYRAGHLYVNVHSNTHPGGEIRAQLKP